MRLSLEDVPHELSQDASRAKLHEEPPPILVYVLDFFLEQDRVEDVLCQRLLDGLRISIIRTTRCVRIDRTSRVSEFRGPNGLGKGLLRMTDERRVEGRRHGQGNDPVTLFLESFLQGGKFLCGAGQDDFLLRIQIRDGYGRFLLALFPNRFHISNDGQHASPVETGIVRRGHRLAPGPGQPEEVIIVQDLCCPEGRQFTETVSCHKIGFKSALRQKPVHARTEHPDRGLGELCLPQPLIVDLPFFRLEYGLWKHDLRKGRPTVLLKEAIHVPIRIDQGREIVDKIFPHLHVL